jgi:hypothetical protein
MSKNRPNLDFYNGIGSGSVSVDDTAGGTIIVPERNEGQGYSYIYIRNTGSQDVWITVGDVLIPLTGTGILLQRLEWFEWDVRGMAVGNIRGITSGPATTISYLLGD